MSAVNKSDHFAATGVSDVDRTVIIRCDSDRFRQYGITPVAYPYSFAGGKVPIVHYPPTHIADVDMVVPDSDAGRS